MTTQDSNTAFGSDSNGSEDGSKSRYRIATGDINKRVDEILDSPPTRTTVKISAEERTSLLRQAIRRTARLFKPHGGQ